MKKISAINRAVIMGVLLTGIVCFVLYDIGFNNSVWCNTAMEKFISFIGSFARQLERWGDKLFGQYLYHF